MDDKPMTTEQSVRGLVTLLAHYQTILGVLVEVYPEMTKNQALVDLLGMTDAAFDDAARYLPPGELRRMLVRVRASCAPIVREARQGRLIV